MAGRSAIVGRADEMALVQAGLTAAEQAHGSLLLLAGPAGIGKTRILEEALREAEGRGFTTARGTSLPESLTLYHPWMEALDPIGLAAPLVEEPPPRLLALYALSPAGLPAARVERQGFSEDPATMAMMLGAVAEFVRDGLAKGAGGGSKGILRVAEGSRGFCAIPFETFGLVAVLEGRESEVLLQDLAELGRLIEKECGTTLRAWDGNRNALRAAEASMRALLLSPRYEGVVLPTEGAARKFSVFENVLLGLRRKTREAPILIAIDDLQWADPSSLGLLHYLARNTTADKVFLIGLHRAEEEATEHLKRLLVSLAREGLAARAPVGPLAPPEIEALARDALGGRPPPPDLASMLVRTSEGNPLFILEVLRQLEADGTLVPGRDGSDLKLARRVEDLRIPAKVGDVISGRLALLNRGERDLAEAAAVLGARFRGDLLARVTERREGEVLRMLNAIARDYRIMRAEQAGWKFDHVMIREVLYGSLGPELRRYYHLHAAEALFDSGSPAAEVGEHFAAAGDGRAVPLLREAAASALERGAPDEAARFYMSASGLLEGESRSALEADAGDALFEAGRFEEAQATYGQARQATGDRDRRVILAALEGRALERQGLLEGAMVALQNEPPSLQVGELAKGRWLAARAWLDLRGADLPGAERNAQAALEALSRAGGPADDIADCWNTLAGASYNRGSVELQESRLREGIAAAERGNARYQAARLKANLVNVAITGGRIPEAKGLAEEAVRAAGAAGNRLFVALGQTRLSHCKFCLGQIDEAAKLAGEAAQLLGGLGVRERQAEALGLLALCHLERGNLFGAEEEARRALARTQEGSEQKYLAMIRLAEVLAPAGKVAEARSMAEGAINGCTRQGIAILVPYAKTVQARVEGIAGRPERACGLFEAALGRTEGALDPWTLAQGYRWWGEALAAAGRGDEATEKLLMARERFISMRGELELGKVESAMALLRGPKAPPKT